ncbi:hypothetical protein F2Q68_00044241 [Brassica cretica]|uniref:Uncharacterized protein n=1 Tax=Brassica cretica TaxID=69181 RepID=A0A8S9LP25_BRACR|nr:hypothetical protein F2Q68_00044241 [Brassica cretica]
MIMEEVSVWFLSQSLEQQEEHKEKKDEERIKKRWSKPYQNWLAYKKSQTAGCSWMVTLQENRGILMAEIVEDRSFFFDGDDEHGHGGAEHGHGGAEHGHGARPAV